MADLVQTKNYGASRQRGPTVSYEEIERAARGLMAKGERPTVDGVRAALGRGSPNHIAASMRKFWKNQAAVTTGNPLALTHLPPELADAAVAQWEKALSLAQQTAQVDDSAARAHLEQLRRETAHHARALGLREKDWDIAARVRERALVEARDQINVLLKELAADRGELRSREARIADLESQNEGYRQQLALVVTRAVARNRALRAKKLRPKRSPARKPKARIRATKRPQSKRPKPRARR
jgi:Plasmid replication region DNA-binding N-term